MSLISKILVVLNINLKLKLSFLSTDSHQRHSMDQFFIPSCPSGGLFSNFQENKAFKQSQPFGAIKPCMTLAFALLSLSIAQHQHCCLALALLTHSISQPQDCTALALPSISIAYSQHCIALTLHSLSIDKHQPLSLFELSSLV